MLKIKDNVGFRELEKFGYEYMHTCFCKDVEPDWVLRINLKTREIKCWNFVSGKKKNAKPYIQDLIQAGLVEKVGE